MSTIEEQQDAPAGWSGRGIAALGMAVIAGASAFVLLYGDRAAAEGGSGVWIFVTETLLGHIAGGFVAGWLLGGLFGRRGIAGWPLALLGGVLACLLGGVLGAAIASLPGFLAGAEIATLLVELGGGLLVTPLAMLGAPVFAVLWLVAVMILHVLVRRVRKKHAAAASA